MIGGAAIHCPTSQQRRANVLGIAEIRRMSIGGVDNAAMLGVAVHAPIANDANCVRSFFSSARNLANCRPPSVTNRSSPASGSIM